MRYQLDLWRRLLAVQMRSQIYYRTSFWVDLVGVAFNTIVSFLSLALVLQHFGGIAGWSVGEVAFLFGMIEIAFGSMDMLFSGFDPANFGRQVRFGRFDQILLRPVSITLQVLGSEFLLRRFGRILMGMVVFVIAISMAHIHWTLAKLLYLPVVYLSLVCFFGGLFMIGATFTFWTVEGIEFMNIFTYGGSEMMSYPMNIYADWMQKFFTYILPAIFLNYYPALFFLDKPDPLHMPAFAPFLAPLAGLFVLFAARLFWNFGIRHYQSTGS